jgi:formate dehydrogenase subunit gamma
MLNTLQLEAPHSQIEDAPASRAQVASPTLMAGKKVSSTGANSKVLRFAKTERIVHWAIAVPFLVSFATALILVLVYNPDPSRPYRSIFAVIHRVSGVALIVFPLLATFKSKGDAMLHFYNIKQAWTWVFDDFKWLALKGVAAINSKIELPEAGKFNAGEKINFMVLMTTYPLYVATGLLMWLTHLAILSWIMHFLMALLATPLLLGHLYMALFNADSRQALPGMFTGLVERKWAKHHHGRWYKEHYGETETHPAEAKSEEPDAPIPPAEDRSAGPEIVSPVVREEWTVRSVGIPSSKPASAASGVQWFITEIDSHEVMPIEEPPVLGEEEKDQKPATAFTTRPWLSSRFPDSE